MVLMHTPLFFVTRWHRSVGATHGVARLRPAVRVSHVLAVKRDVRKRIT